MEDIEYIRKTLPRQVLFLQMAEEAAELSAACSKVARILDGQNPAGKTLPEAVLSVMEEFTDVTLAAEAVQVEAMGEIRDRKLARWVDRLTRRA